MSSRSGAVLSLLLFGALGLGACSTARKEPKLELSELEGRKVALVEIEGSETERRVIEVALINQLVKNGSFILVNKKEVEKARSLAEIDPRDWKAVGTKAGADLALRVKVKRFTADTKEGYSREEVYDSQLAEDAGEDHGTTSRLYKVKSMHAKVEAVLEFYDPKEGTTTSGTAQAEEEVRAEAKRGAAHLPPKLRFLEQVANQAFERFFNEYR